MSSKKPIIGSTVSLLLALTTHAQTTYEARHEAFYDDISGRKINLGQTDGPHRAGRTGFWTTQGRLQRGMATSNPGKVWGELKTVITNADGAQDAGGANGGFSGWPGMDTYMRWQHLMPQDVKDAYVAEYVGLRTYGNGSTPNQRIMWAAACRLACETWGTAAVTVNSNASNKTGEPTGKKYIENICDRTVKYNFEERWAKHYLAYTLGPLRTIADLSSDPVLANKARMTWNWGWMDIASFSFNGRWSIPAGRSGLVQDGNSSDISEFGSWLMFGGTPRANPLDMDQSLNVTQPKVGVPYGVTQPPIIPEMLEAATNRDVPYTRRGMARVHETQFATTYMTKDWTMYSQLEADTTLNPDGTLKIKDLDNGGVPSNDWSSERWAVMWDETGPAGLTMKAPTGYGWAQGSGLGPHEDVVQHEGTLVGIFNIPATWEWQYTRDSIPTNTTAVINDAATTGRLFLHYSKVLIAITRSDIGNFTWPPAAQTTCTKRGFAIECASVSEYPQSTPEARLAAFKADIEAHPADTSHVNDATPRMIYTTRAGRVLDITYGQGGKVDGSPLDYEGWPLNESPWSYQAQMGNMWVFGQNRKLLWNYKTWTESVDNAPTATTTAPVAAAGAAPVDVDLSTRIADTETASAALKYRVTGATNGTAKLLADGKTVRFTPPAIFAGASTFSITAGGAFPDHRFVAHYDNEDTAIGRDVSTNDRHATSSVGGIASAARVTDVPAATADANNLRSLHLTSGAFGSAKISRSLTPATLNFSNHDWTFATWVKRESYADDDFIFYVGDGDGFSGSGEELQVWLPAQSKTVAVRHYNASNAQTFSLSSAATLDIGDWHHVAVQFARTSHNTGVVKLYLDGELAGTSASVTWALKQSGPVFIGGPAASTALMRGFNGWLDDMVLARGVLSADDIAQLASASAAHLGGAKLTHTFTVNSAVLAPGGLSATAANNAVSLAWNAVGGATSYKVKRGTASSGPFTTLASGITATSHTDATAVPGTTYYYVVTAVNGVGESGNSNVANTALPASEAAIWNNAAMAAWSHGARIASPGYTGSETLTNFPMLVRLDATNVPGFSYAQMAFSNGADLRFTDANGVELSYEIESWNPGGTSLVWVKVPSLVKGGSILAYWGNSTATATTTPDAVSGLAMWLKADALSLADGATVSTWTDSSGNSRNATLSQGMPTFETNELNGNPVVRFTVNGESSFTFPTMTNIRTVFWVVKETAAAPHFLLGDDNTYHFHRGAAGGTIWDATYASANVRNGTTKLNGAAINGTTTPLGTGWKLVSLVTAGNCEASRLSRDRTIAARSWDGGVAEVIVYDRALTANEELLIGGYLAQKYALPTAYAGAAPGYTSDGSTWSGGFTGVWHLNSTNVTDSTATPQNTTSNATVTTGKVGSSLLHNGTSQHAIIPDAADMNVLNNFELSGWFKMAPGDKTNWRTLWAKETDSNTRNWWLSVNGGGQVWWTSSAGTDITSTTDLADNQWHYVSAVNDGSYSRLYIDGVQVGTDSAANEEQTTWAVRLGSENSTRWWKGSLDEFRISNVKRSATWVRATFDNINDAAWARSGNVTPNAAGFAPMVSTRAATSVGSTSATMNGNLASTGGSTTTVIIYHGSTDGGTNPAAWAGANNLGARSVGNFSSSVSSLANGTTRYYRAFASNATGSSWAPETVSFITDTAAPTGLTPSPGSGLVNLAWTATPGAVSYNLKRGTAVGGPFTTLLANILTPAAADTSAADGSTYFYVVSAVNGGGESANSTAVSVATLAPPADLVATAGNASVALTWSAVSGATSYTVKRSPTSEGTYAVVQSGIAGTTFTDTTATNGSTYFYVVTASNASFESGPSSEANATPSASVATPTGLTGTPANTSALLSWNAVAGATQYRVKRATVSGGPYTTVGDPVYAPSFTSGGLTNGTPYFFVVSALNGSVEGANSAQVSVTPGPTPTTFTTASAGTWSAATWTPQQPFSGFETVVAFNNTSVISSTANLGTLIANKLNLTNAAVTLSGDSLFFLGTAPGITTTANTTHSIANNLTLDGASTMNIASNTTTLSGVLNGNGGITKTGAGSLVVTGANTHTGNTAVNAGVLNIRHADALGSGEVTVAIGAELQLQGGISVGGRRVTVTGSGNNGALKSISGDNTWAGEISAVAVSGITRIASDAGTFTLSGEITQDTGSTDQLVFQGNGGIVVTGAISGPSRVTRSSTGTGVVSLIGDNTYTGQTLLNGGVTEVESISSLVGDPGDEEVALNSSGLGAPNTTANGTITMGNGGTTATLRFIGPTLKTDRVIALAGSIGGATIEQNGTGTLTLLSAFTATGAGTKTLTFSGTGIGVAAGAIADNSATNETNVAKSGAGTWTLGGVNTYTGTTTVNAGTLLMTGSIAAGGNVTVASGATFGGGGTVTPNTTVNGNLALNGTLNFGGTLAFGAGARVKMNVAANSTTAGNAVAATATVSTGAVVDVTLNASGSGADFSYAFWNTARSWPIVTAASRTGSFTLGTVSADIAGRPASGYGTFTISQTSTTANLVWTPLTAIEQWRFTHFGTNANAGNAADNADPDADGVINLAEFNGGSNPNDVLSIPTFIFNNVAGGNWSGGANWNTGVAPVGNASLAVEVFTGQTLVGTVAVTNDLGGTLTLNSLRLGGTGSGTVVANVSGGPLQFAANGDNAPFIQLAAFSSNVSVNVANNITLGADVTIKGTNTGNFNFSGILSGPGGITRTDSYSTLTLSGMNTYTGPTVLQSGVTAISAAANLGAPSAPLTLDGGTLRINGTTLVSMSALGRTVTFAPDKTVTLDVATSTHSFTADLVLNQESGGLVKNGAGVLVLTQPNTFTGATTLNSGTLAISAGDQLGDPPAALVFNGGTLRINGTTLTSLADLGRTVTFTAAKPITFDIADVTHTFEVAQTLDQTTGSLTKLGAGTLELNTANTFTGSVNVNAGVLRISQASALGGASKSVFCTTGVARLELDGAGSDITLPATTTVLTSGAQSTGALRNVSGNNTIAGPLLLTTGAGNSQILSDGGTLTLAGNITTSPSTGARTLFLGGTASGSVTGNIADNGGANIVSVTKNGPGTWTLSGTNTYTGATTVSAGRLAISGTSTSNITATTGSLATSGTPSTTGNVAINSGARFETNLGTLNVGGSLTLAGALDIIAAPGITNGTAFTILNKTSAGAISGTFAGKPQGSIFAASGYFWLISYTGGNGNGVTITTQTFTQIEQWRLTHFGTIANTGTAADTFDANNDGEANLLEFATAQNPTISTLMQPTLMKNGTALEFTYTRASAALADGVTFIVEWSDTLLPALWSSVGVTEQILSDNGTVQSVKTSVPAGMGQRFLHLRIVRP